MFEYKVVYSLTLAGFASLAVCHVVEDVLHGAAVGQGAGPHLPVGLLAPLALMCMEQQDQLLLNEFALLGIGRRACGHATSTGDHAHRCYLRLHLGLQKVDNIQTSYSQIRVSDLFGF